MATLPQLLEEDIQVLDEVLNEFLRQTSATAALIIDKGGFLITHQGDAGDVDFTTLSALASGAFMASQTIAGLVSEKNFNSTFQQGEKFSLLVVDIDEHCLLTILFKSQTGVGVDEILRFQLLQPDRAATGGGGRTQSGWRVRSVGIEYG